MQLLSSRFHELPHNTKVTILAQPLWAIPAGLVTSYFTLYMLELGFSSQQIGIVSSISTTMMIVSALLAGWAIDRIGRKLSTVIFDFVSWVIPFYLWATANDLKSFIIAGIINGFVAITSVSYECFYVEDVPANLRIVAQRYRSIMDYVYSFMPSIMGLLISRFTVIPAMRSCYWFAFICAVIFVSIKSIFLRDTNIGVAKRTETNNFSLKGLFMRYVGVIKYISVRKELLVLYAINLLAMFGRKMTELYFIPYLSQKLGLSSLLIGWVPVITTLISILVVCYIVPKMYGRYRYLLAYGLIAHSIGGLLISFATPALAIPLVLVNIVLWGFSNGSIHIVLKTQIYMLVDDYMQGNFISTFQVFSMIAMLPCGIIGGHIYAVLPAATIGIIGLAFVFVALFYYKLLRKGWFTKAENL